MYLLILTCWGRSLNVVQHLVHMGTSWQILVQFLMVYICSYLQSVKETCGRQRVITDQWVVHQVALSLLFHFLLFRFDQNIWSHSQFSVLLIYLLLIWLWIDVHVWFLLYLSFSEFVFFQEFVYWFSVSVSDVDRLSFLLVFPRLLQHTIISCYGNQRQTR